MQSSFSVLGLYEYDNTLFANMSYPTGFSDGDKTTLVNNLLMDLAELEVIYPRPDFMKSAIATWSAKEQPTWNRIYAAAQLEYNPIENYDRQETSTDSTEASRQHSGKDTTTNSGKDTTTNSGKDTTQHSGTDSSTGTLDNTTRHSGNDVDASSGTDTVTNSGHDTNANTGTDTTTNSGSDVTTNEVAAFNSTTPTTHDKSTIQHGHIEATQHGLTTTVTHGHIEATQHGLTHTLTHGEQVVVDEDTTYSVTHGAKEELTHGHVEELTHGHIAELTHGEKIDDESETTRTSRIHGNIGVTTSQQMLEQELEIAPKLNIMNIIIESFKNRFCLLVY